jgi:hypothetical protein
MDNVPSYTRFIMNRISFINYYFTCVILKEYLIFSCHDLENLNIDKRNTTGILPLKDLLIIIKGNGLLTQTNFRC